MIQGVLLAAGSASRFGGGKLLHPLPDGTPLGIASYRNLKAACPHVIVVVRESDETLRRLFEIEDAALVICHDASKGLSRSLIAGIRASENADGWLIALADMPFVLPATIEKLVAKLATGSAIVLPAYGGRRGNPVGLDRRHREALLALQGDEGARSIVKRYATETDVIECDDPGILRDIDTRADLG
jgi:molybdenum cofactor cytidylyltransferase